MLDNLYWVLQNVGSFVIGATGCWVICTRCYRLLGNLYLVLQNVG
jgi:hypothetical protein